jgi:hypothetical protein
MQVFRHFASPVTGLICMVICGCGPSRPTTYPTRGTVRFEDGAPVQTGIVELTSKKYAETATGKIQPDGSFVLGTFSESDGACEGTHSAIVLQFIVNDGITTHSLDHGPAVDLRFGSYETSGLSVELKPQDSNVITLTVRKRQ